DHDPASNTGNWIYVAGVGNDPRSNRKFNTRRQAEMYDGEGKYQTLWSGDALELDVR
ncbi:MAG: FAD-binding domain-containing protein, partial [Flavobacteriales bacterium]